MAIPKYNELMLPLLQFAEGGNKRTLVETIEHLADKFCLKEDDINELLPSGKQSVFKNRVGWARTYLKKAELIEYPEISCLIITELGKKVLSENLSEINIKYLMRFPRFQQFKIGRKIDKTNDDGQDESNKTPIEILEESYHSIQLNIESDLLELVKTMSPSFFERLVVDLLLKMGYGGTAKDAGQAIGKSGDGGIDGIIKQDKLGLDIIYIQAKRWDSNKVGRQELQKFAGSLDMHHADKGVFITTSEFTKEAKDYVEKIQKKIIIIDGTAVARLMLDNNLGVSIVQTFDLKKIDTDYFVDE